jgi:hypothetical protein
MEVTEVRDNHRIVWKARIQAADQETRVNPSMLYRRAMGFEVDVDRGLLLD